MFSLLILSTAFKGNFKRLLFPLHTPPNPGLFHGIIIIWAKCVLNILQLLLLLLSCFSRVQLFATPWTVAYQAPLPMGFSRQEYWSGLPLPSPILCEVWHIFWHRIAACGKAQLSGAVSTFLYVHLKQLYILEGSAEREHFYIETPVIQCQHKISEFLILLPQFMLWHKLFLLLR